MKNDPGELNVLFNCTNPVQQKLKYTRHRFIELRAIAHIDASIIL